MINYIVHKQIKPLSIKIKDKTTNKKTINV